MSSAMETSLSSSSSSSSTSVASSVDDNDDNNNDNDNGILDDLLVPGDYAAAINGSKIQSSSSSVAMLSGECYCYTEGIRTQRQRQRQRDRDREEDRHKLFDKRWYRSPQMLPASVASSMASDDKTKHRTPKTEPETAVLADCIHNHFLLACNRHHHRRRQQQQHLHHNHGLGNDGGDDSSSSNIMVEAILSRFEKVTCRTNEIIFREGDVAEYLYVLYRGEVLVRVRRSSEPEPETEPHTNGNENENQNGNGNQNHDDGGEEEEDNDDHETKYKILGELELLTNSSSYRSTTKATSDPCVLFRLAARDFREYFIPHRGKARLDIPNDEDKYEDKYEYDERALEILKRAMPPELSAYFFPQNGDNDYHRKLWLQLWSERTIRNFRAGDVLVHKSKPVRGLVIVTEGLVRATNNTAGGRSYEDLAVGPDQSRSAFGWQSVLVLVPPSDKDVVVDDDDDDEDATEPPDRSSSSSSSSIPMMGTVRAETDGQAIVISKKSFETVFCHSCYHHEHHHYHHRPPLLDVAALRRRQWKLTQLQQITVFRDSGLDATQIDGLLDGMHHCEYGREEPILKAGQKVDAAMYFVRRGTVRLERNKGRDVQLIEKGGYFGETNMLLDQNKSDNDRHYRKRSVVSAISVTDSTKLDVLYLEECRTVVNTRILGLGKNTNATVTAIDESVRWADLKRHKLIGTGGFGQVWLVSTSTSNSNSSSSRTTDAVTTTALGESGDAAATNGTNGTTKRRRFFALKVQAKFSILQSNDATSLIAERNIMASLRSPFLLRLFNAFQDDHRLYMVTSLLQGGELESIVPETGFPERVARFYAAGVLEALTHLHRRHILHRDVKPENILLNGKGYPVLIDFGFAKYVPEKTYTFCGSPMFMAPETILYQGQTKGVDHWAWAVLVYRLVTGNYPFYNSKGMSEMALYKRICRGTFEVTGAMSADFRMLLISVLVPDPSQRLGSRANGWRDLFDAPWLAKAFSPSDRIQLRKQALPAPWIRVSPGDGSANEHDGDCDNDDDDDAPGSFVHQSSSEVEDLLDNDICGKIADDQQHIFASFGPRVDSPIGNI